MKRRLNYNEFKKWTNRVGGLTEAKRLISQVLECSKSKAEKLASGRYPSVPSPAEQLVISALIHRTRDQLFPVVGAKVKKKI